VDTTGATLAINTTFSTTPFQENRGVI
jgi:hypothetical protein